MANAKTDVQTANDFPLVPGDQIHFLRPSVSFSTKPNDLAGAFLVISERGQTITITSDLIEATMDVNGDSWLALVDDPEAQVRRWGEQTFARGAAPEGMTSWTPGTIDQLLTLEAERQRLRDSIGDPQELALAMRELNASPLGRNVPVFANTTILDGGRG